MAKKVLISGGTGLIGRKITEKLIQNGDEVAWLSRSSRSENQQIRNFLWDPSRQWLDPEAIQWPTHIINLAGESIGETPWTMGGKLKILNSRTDTVKTLVAELKKRTEPLSGFVGVSGVGIYGPGAIPKSESDLLGNDFPAEVAKAWEQEYKQITPSDSAKTAILRLAVVLSSRGGALPKIMMPVRFAIGVALGSGRQPFNWIHLDDAAEGFVQALNWDGIFNVAAPENVSNFQATKLIAKVLNRPFFLPNVPAFLFDLVLGDRSKLVTEGNVANIEKLIKTGFQFQFPEFEFAVRDLISRKI